MSGIGSSRPLAPLMPVWWIDHPETLLWRGAGRVTGQRADRETELVVTWQPELDVRFRQEPDDTEDLELFLDEERGERAYAVTHIGELSRADRGAFGAGELQEALTCIHFLFSFARAAWAAPMLLVGFDQDGVLVWWQASPRWCTAGLGRGLTWLDRHDGAGLEEVAHLWLELWQDPLWRQVLPRAVIYYLEANRQGRDAPSFLEVKYTMAQAGLELLAWAILKEDPITAAGSGPWHRDKGAAAKNVREPLTWAGIPSAVPAELPDLAQALRAHEGWQDAAHLVPWLRNQEAYAKSLREFGVPACRSQ